MKKTLFSLLLVSLALVSTQAFSQKLYYQNYTDCDYNVDISTGCGATSGGPFFFASNCVSGCGFTSGISGPSIQSIAFEEVITSDLDYVFFGGCGIHTSPHELDISAITCTSAEITVSWSVRNVNDFFIEIR